MARLKASDKKIKRSDGQAGPAYLSNRLKGPKYTSSNFDISVPISNVEMAIYMSIKASMFVYTCLVDDTRVLST